MSAAVAPCEIAPPFPGVVCRRHGRQASGYWICRHVVTGKKTPAIVNHGDRHLSGVALCRSCLDAEGRSTNTQKLAERIGLTLVCPVCAGAVLVERIAEVKP